MTEHQKLIFIGTTLQDVINCIEWGKLKSKPTLGLDEGMINESLTMVEDLRGKHFDEGGELIITQGDKKIKEMLEN
jgi:hypothetical protein